MFKILNGREYFFQWDSNQKLIVEDPSILEVHFCNGSSSNSLVCRVYDEDGARVVNVPNSLLQDYWKIKVYGYLENYTKIERCFEVIKRSKPEDYIYTETEIKRYEALEERVEALEKNGGNTGGGECLINEIAELKPTSMNVYKPVPVEEWVDNSMQPEQQTEGYMYTIIPVESGKTYTTTHCIENPLVFVNKDEIEGTMCDIWIDAGFSEDYSVYYDLYTFTIPEGYNYLLLCILKLNWGNYQDTLEGIVNDFNSRFMMIEGKFPVNELDGWIYIPDFIPYTEGYVIKEDVIQKELLIEETAEAAAALIDNNMLRAIGNGVLR